MSPGRSQEVDWIRSAALLGICVVNVPFMALPIEALLAPPRAMHDRAATFLVELLFQGKFFLLFSFLFGWGFGVQLAAAARRGVGGAAPYVRRLAGLVLFGILNAVLVFYGDILLLYAGLGLLLWLVRNWSPAALMRLAFVMIVVTVPALLVLAGAIGSDPTAAMTSTTRGPGYLGSFADAVRQRIVDWREASGFILLFNGPPAFAAFCAGLAAFKCGFFDTGSASYAAFRRWLPWLAAPATVGNALYAASLGGLLGAGDLAGWSFAALAVGGPSLAALYLAGIVAVVRNRNIPSGWAAAGRMSLTAYIAEGVVAGLVFNGYGLALFGRLGPLALLATACVIYVVVHVGCALWLRFRPLGPLEWLLRRVTRGPTAH